MMSFDMALLMVASSRELTILTGPHAGETGPAVELSQAAGEAHFVIALGDQLVKVSIHDVALPIPKR